MLAREIRLSPANLPAVIGAVVLTRIFFGTSSLPHFSPIFRNEGSRMTLRKELVTSLCCAAVSAGLVLLLSTGITAKVGAAGPAAKDPGVRAAAAAPALHSPRSARINSHSFRTD